MPDWRDRLDMEALRNFAQRAYPVVRPFAPAFAITMAVIALPVLLLYLMPLVLGLFAPRLDPAIDLYAVNRPLAFTFLDVDGNEVGHRGAVVGERLKLRGRLLDGEKVTVLCAELGISRKTGYKIYDRYND